MCNSVLFRAGILAVSMAILPAIPPHAHAAAPEESAANLFDARDQGRLAVRFVPASEKKGTLTLSNRTRSPLTVRVPDTLGAVPAVLAQILPGQMIAQRPDTPQMLGLALPGNAVIRQTAWGSERPGRLIQIPARGQVRIVLQGVCLQHGNPTPNSRMHYELVPLSHITRDPRLTAAIASLANEAYAQPAVQLVAWHLANGRTFKSLRNKFSSREMKAAEQLLQEVSAPARPAPATPAPEYRADKAA